MNNNLREAGFYWVRLLASPEIPEVMQFFPDLSYWGAAYPSADMPIAEEEVEVISERIVFKDRS